MQEPTTPPNADATIVTGDATVTMHLDVTTLAERIARLVARYLVADAARADAAANAEPDRNGAYIPDLPRGVPPRMGEHGLIAQGCPSCGSTVYAEPDRPGELCAECQQHGDLRDRE